MCFFWHCWCVWLSFFTPSSYFNALVVISQNLIHFNLLHTYTHAQTVESYWGDHVRQAMTTYGITSIYLFVVDVAVDFYMCHFDSTLPFFFVSHNEKSEEKKAEHMLKIADKQIELTVRLLKREDKRKSPLVFSCMSSTEWVRNAHKNPSQNYGIVKHLRHYFTLKRLLFIVICQHCRAQILLLLFFCAFALVKCESGIIVLPICVNTVDDCILFLIELKFVLTLLFIIWLIV